MKHGTTPGPECRIPWGFDPAITGQRRPYTPAEPSEPGQQLQAGLSGVPAGQACGCAHVSHMVWGR